MLSQALAQTDAALTARLKARFEGDRTGACAVAAIEGDLGLLAHSLADDKLPVPKPRAR